MSRFTIIPTGRSSSSDIIAQDPRAVLGLVRQIDCTDADILEDGRYTFSVRLSDTGLWSIFQREPVTASHDFSPLG
jgi:hypothetical protein